MKTSDYITLGRAVTTDFPDFNLEAVPARVDTGAKTSAMWASNIVEKEGALHFVLFDPSSAYYTGKIITVHDFSQRMVASSNGIEQERYAVKLLVHVGGKKIRATFTLADRSTQVYPVLIGRNILRGKFIVDVKQGIPLLEQERARSIQLQAKLAKGKES